MIDGREHVSRHFQSRSIFQMIKSLAYLNSTLIICITMLSTVNEREKNVMISFKASTDFFYMKKYIILSHTSVVKSLTLI